MNRPGIILLLLLLAACAGPPAPKDAFYRLEVAPPAKTFERPPLPGVLEVDRLEADGAVAERALAFETRPGGPVERYRYDFWSEQPGIMLQDRLAAFLRAANAAGRVVTPELRVPPDWTLRGKIRRFEQVAGADKVAVELQLAVVSARDGSLVLLDTFHAEAPAGSGVEGMVAAIGRATSEVLARFLADLGNAKVPAR
jgi:ABC-type uncharacterized transport system auxiliary subunit